MKHLFCRNFVKSITTNKIEHILPTSHLLQKTLQYFSKQVPQKLQFLRTSHFKAQVSKFKLEAHSPQSVIFTQLDMYDSTPLMV